MTEQTDPSSVLHALTMIALVIHIAGGAIGLVSGTIAVVARKGGHLHRKAGTVFVGSMLVMATFAIYLGFAMPGQTLNVFIGAFALYLVTTAWMTVRQKGVSAGNFEKVALVVAVCLCAPFAVLTFQLITGLPTFFTGAMTFKGPIVIATYSFTIILALAVGTRDWFSPVGSPRRRAFVAIFGACVSGCRWPRVWASRTVWLGYYPAPITFRRAFSCQHLSLWYC